MQSEQGFTIDDIDVCISKNLREKRKKRGLTLVEVAKRVGVSHQQVQKYEHGTSKISASMLYKFSLVYGVDICHFFDGFEQSVVEKQNGEFLTDINKNSTINILLVEDNPGDEVITRRALSDMHGVNIFCVHDVVQALDFLRYKTISADFRRPDLILLDVGLPVKSGLVLLKDIKRDRVLMDIQVVMLTSNISISVLNESYKNGAAGYICKSFDFNVFKANLCDCVQYWRHVVVIPRGLHDM